jgi:hypothetical protein
MFRVSASAALTANAASYFHLSFQEQEIQVSVSNTLPQFSESDSCVRLSGGNGYGSTNLTTRRFASTIQNIGSDIQYIDSPTLGGQFIAQSSGLYNVSYSEESTTAGAESSVQLKVNGVLVAFDNQVYNTSAGISRHASLSWQGYLTIGDIVAGNVSAAANSNGSTVLFTISKVGKPNVTGVNVTPFVNVPQPVSQSSFLNSTTTFAAGAITGALASNTNTGIYSYNSSTGTYTALKTATFSIDASLSTVGAAAIIPYITRNGAQVAASYTPAVAGAYSTVCYTGVLNTGDTLVVLNGSANSTNVQQISVTATATSDTILTAPETFSTDTAALTYASSAAYTLATLNTAPVGTFITFTYAINTNTRTQTTTAPTQTTADMNANGMLIYTRAFNATSTAAQPATLAIQIGKGLKGKSLDLYKSAGKVTSGTMDSLVQDAGTQFGSQSTYNEITGVLIIDAAIAYLGGNTTRVFQFADVSNQTSGYLVVNASKNPALTGMGIERVAARGINTSGQSFAGALSTMTLDSVKTFDTHNALNAATGVFTAPVSGYYQINASLIFASAAYAAANTVGFVGYKNSTNYSEGTQERFNSAVTQNVSCGYSELVYLAKNDTFAVRVFNERGSTALVTTSGSNYFSISKISGIN